MKNTRKLFAGLTALCCTGSIMSAFPVTVNAEILPWTCRVSLIQYDEQQQPENYIVTEFRYWNYIISAEEMQTYLADGSEMPAVGDVIEIFATGAHPAELRTFSFKEDSSIVNCGNEWNYFTETKEYLVTKHSEDFGGAYWTRLTDPETGSNYLYVDYQKLYDSPYSLKEVSVGDTVTCAMNIRSGSYPAQVLSITEGNSTLPDIPEQTVEYPVNIIFMGESASPEGRTYPANYAVNSDYKFSEWTLTGFSYIFNAVKEDELPQYGDVYSSDYMVIETYPAQFEPYTLKKIGTVEDMYPIKEVTVTENHPDTNQLILTDSAGTEYHYSYDLYNYVNWKFDTPIQKLQTGDTLKCAFTENDIPLMVTDIVNTSAKDGLTVNPVVTVSANGDADGSGALDIVDVITVNKAILGKEDISADRIPYVDFNNNGIPDSEDSLIMMKKIVGLV